jgi:hypothetical protein
MRFYRPHCKRLIIKMGMPSPFDVSMTLVVLTLLCLSREATATEYIYHFCSDKTTFTPNSTFQSNLDHLFSSLSSNAGRQDGFYNTTVGQNASDTVYGLFLCRGDLTFQDCQKCVGTAAQDLIQQYCRLGKEAVIWYEECMLHYSDQYFFSKMNTQPGVHVPSKHNISDPDHFNQLLMATTKGLVSQVANMGIGAKKFATKEAKFTGSQILYTLEECTPDISSSDCNKCIQKGITLMQQCCSGIQGARVFFPSCRIRYEVYQFYQMPAILPPPPGSSKGIRFN